MRGFSQFSQREANGRLFRGDVPADLPGGHELAVNAIHGRERGIRISQEILLRADRVIE